MNIEDIRIHFGADDFKRVGVKLIFLGYIRINVEQMILKGLELN